MKNEADSRTRPSSSRLLTEPGRLLMEHDLSFASTAMNYITCSSSVRTTAVSALRIGSRTTNFSAVRQAALLEWLTMRISGYGSVRAVHRKMRSPSAVGKDPGVTDQEKTNAEGLKTRLKQQLREAETPAGDCDRRSL